MAAEFKIKITRISHCKKYCELVESFHFTGYIKLGREIIEKDDILRIIENCLFKEVQFVVNTCTDTELVSIQNFLAHSGMIHNQI